jgi:hypothetical protein
MYIRHFILNDRNSAVRTLGNFGKHYFLAWLYPCFPKVDKPGNIVYYIAMFLDKPGNNGFF